MACPMTFGSKDIAIIPITTWYCQTAPHTNIVSRRKKRREKKKRERRRGEKKKK